MILPSNDNRKMQNAKKKKKKSCAHLCFTVFNIFCTKSSSKAAISSYIKAQKFDLAIKTQGQPKVII